MLKSCGKCAEKLKSEKGQTTKYFLFPAEDCPEGYIRPLKAFGRYIMKSFTFQKDQSGCSLENQLESGKTAIIDTFRKWVQFLIKDKFKVSKVGEK